MTVQDEYQAFMDTIEIVPMPENYRAVMGKRVCQTEKTVQPLFFRTAKNSFVQMNFAVTVPQRAMLVTEERPEFSHRYKPADTTILRMGVTVEGGLAASVHHVGMLQDDDEVKKGDVLMDGGSVEVYWPYQTRQMVALVNIPEETPPGEYHGTVRFYSHSMLFDERVAREFPFTIRVENVTIPRGENRKFYLNLWQHIFNAARRMEVKPYTQAHLDALRPFCRAYGELGGRVATLVASDIPWNGQGCYNDNAHPTDFYEYNYIRIRRTADGAYRYDFSFAEKYIAMMEEYGARDIMLAGLYGIWGWNETGFESIVADWPDQIRVSYINEADGSLGFMRTRAEIEDYIRAIYDWLCRKNLLGRTHLMGDEVDLGSASKGWGESLAIIRRLMPGIQLNWDCGPETMCSDACKDMPMHLYTPQIDLWTPASPEEQEELRRRLDADGHLLWSVCCHPPVMNSFLYTNLCEVRLHGLITEHLKMEGFIRWNFIGWPEQVREDLRFLTWPAGDTCFVYPGRGGQCLLSLRYLALRRGIEDFELCQMLKAQGGQETVDAAVNCVVRQPDMRRWDYLDYAGREKYMSLNDADYQRARNLLLDGLTRS